MKTITLKAKEAFLNGKSFKNTNTEVAVKSTTVELWLFGNMIAYYVKGTTKFHIQNCGWFSNTTKERLNALPNVYIQQKNYVWYLNGEIWNGYLKEISM